MTLKIQKLKLNNFAKFTKFECEFDGKITHLVGANGCLAGGTVVNFNRADRGFKRTIEQAYESLHHINCEHIGNKGWVKRIDTQVRSFKEDSGKIGRHTIDDIVYNGIKPLFSLRLASGREIKATANHEFLVRVSENTIVWKRLEFLCLGDMLMIDLVNPKGSSVVSKQKKIADKEIWGIKFHRYARKVCDDKTRKKKTEYYRLPVHRLIYEAHINKIDIEKYISLLKNGGTLLDDLIMYDPEVFHIHHKDGDHFNNDISNLELIEFLDHLRIHGDEGHFANFSPQFDKVVNIEYFGEGKTYDIVCQDPYRNFSANGIIVHNSGKSTIGLTSIWSCLKGIAVNNKSGQLIGDRFRFIGPARASADIELVLEDHRYDPPAIVKVKNHITRQSNKISFEAPDNYEISHEWLNGLLSVAFLSAKNFTSLSSKEQALLLGIDTSEFDAKLNELRQEFTFVNKEIKNLGKVEPVEKVEPIDIKALMAEKDEIAEFNGKQNLRRVEISNVRENLEELKSQAKASGDVIASLRAGVESGADEINAGKELLESLISDQKEYIVAEKQERDNLQGIEDEIMEIQKALLEKKALRSDIKEQYAKSVSGLADHNRTVSAAEADFAKLGREQAEKSERIKDENRNIEKTLLKIKEIEDDLKTKPEVEAHKDIEAVVEKIDNAIESNKKCVLYDQYLEKVKEREKRQGELAAIKASVYDFEVERLEYIQGCNLGFDSLSVDEKGGLLLDGRPIKEPYFSKGESELIVARIYASKNPELKVRFLDDFELLDEDNQEKILKTLLDEGFQVITAEVGKTKKRENTILLRQCAVTDSYESGKKLI